MNNNYNSFYKKDFILNKIIKGDCFEVLPKIEHNIFDMVFIDPPYFLQKGSKRLKRWNNSNVDNKKVYWDEFDSFEEYDNFIERLLILVKPLMKDTATIWVISTYHSIYRIGKIMQDLGYWILNDVIWFKPNAMPNWMGVRFTNSTETLIWAVKDMNCKKYFFDKLLAREYGYGNNRSNLWIIPVCKKSEKFSSDNGVLHPTQKPLELINRIITISTEKNSLILDPMAGSGTTAISAIMNDRNFVLIEKDEEYINIILKRVNKITNNYAII